MKTSTYKMAVVQLTAQNFVACQNACETVFEMFETVFDDVTVWCALLRVGIIGPYIFEENEVPVSVNCNCYVNMIKEIFLPNLDEIDVGNKWL